MYINYNDYELLYLYNDGNEKAFNILFNKYEHLIAVIVKEYFPYGSKRDDLIQEGRITLYNCIKKYNERINVTFYSYFYISLNRRIKRILKDNYFHDDIQLNEGVISYFSDENSKSYLCDSALNIIKEGNDELLIDIYEQCIIGDLSIKRFARINNLKYERIYYIYKKLCLDLKRKLNDVL